MKRQVKKGDIFRFNHGRRGSYLCVETHFDGGGTGMGPHDVYPDGHRVVAMKLTAEGKFNEKARQIEFYQSGCFTDMYKPADLKHIGTLSQFWA